MQKLCQTHLAYIELANHLEHGNVYFSKNYYFQSTHGLSNISHLGSKVLHSIESRRCAIRFSSLFATLLVHSFRSKIRSMWGFTDFSGRPLSQGEKARNVGAGRKKSERASTLARNRHSFNGYEGDKRNCHNLNLAYASRVLSDDFPLPEVTKLISVLSNTRERRRRFDILVARSRICVSVPFCNRVQTLSYFHFVH